MGRSIEEGLLPLSEDVAQNIEWITAHGWYADDGYFRDVDDPKKKLYIRLLKQIVKLRNFFDELPEDELSDLLIFLAEKTRIQDGESCELAGFMGTLEELYQSMPRSLKETRGRKSIQTEYKEITKILIKFFQENRPSDNASPYYLDSDIQKPGNYFTKWFHATIKQACPELRDQTIRTLLESQTDK